MEIIKEQFKHNGVHYTFLKRDGKIALFGVGTKTSSKIIHWEVSIIYRRKDKYGDREAMPTDSQFGRDRSRYFVNEKQALEYYNKLTLKPYQEVPEVVLGAEEDQQAISECQMIEI